MLQDALDKYLVPLACLTDRDVTVLLEAEDMLDKHRNERQRASAVVHHTFGAVFFLGEASSGDQNSQLQRNLMENISAVAHQASGASAVWETLNINNQDQLSGKHTSASSGNKTSQASMNTPHDVTTGSQDMNTCVVCMNAPMQAGFLHGSR